MFLFLKDLTIILLLLTAAGSHILKLVFLYFKLPFLKKLKYLENTTPSKIELTLYHVLVILACSKSILFFINHNKFN
jgi:hypothetical protein